MNTKVTMTTDTFGNRVWHNKNGELHREDGPAAEHTDGYKAWFINGKRHRTDGPAVELISGYKAWYIDDKLHRTDGPAVEHANGVKEWYIDGKELTEEEFMAMTKQQESAMAVDECGDKVWYLNGALHRLDGPAIKYANGDKAWYIDGKRHRTDGPAVEYANGGKEWWINDKPHRVDGPAIEYPNGYKAWWIDGKLHRTDGPAVEHANGGKGWYINGKKLTEEEFKVAVSKITPATTQKQINKIVDEDTAKANDHHGFYGRVKSVTKSTTETTSADGVVTKTCFEEIKYFKDES